MKERTKELKEKKILYFIISLILLLVTTLALVILLIRKPARSAVEREKLFTLSWSVTLTLMLLIAGIFAINQKICKIVWTINVFLGVMVGNRLGMFIVLILYATYDILYGVYEKAKLRYEIRKEARRAELEYDTE